MRHSYEFQKLWGKLLWVQFEFANHLALITCYRDLSKYGQRTCLELIMHMRVFFCIVETHTLSNKSFEGRY